MSIVIKSGATTDEQTIDPTSKAARVTLYTSAGVEQSALFAGIAVDANNTTTAVLAAGATFTGAPTDILNYSQINLAIYARPGVVAGDGSNAMASLFIEFSGNNSNWDISIPQLIRDPSLVIPIPLLTASRYFRVRYVNDGGVAAIAALSLSDTAGTPTLQTFFRMTTYLLPHATKELTRTMDQRISGSDPAVLVRAGLMGKNPTGSYINRLQSGVSNANNSTAVLTAGSTFTGTFESVLGYASVVVAVDTNQIGTLTVEFSSDGTNILNPVTRSFRRVSAGQTWAFIPTSEFMRVKFTNDSASTQSFLRLETIFKSDAIGNIYTPINTPISEFVLALATLAVPNDGGKATYSAATTITAAVAATDIFTISGSGTRSIRILAIYITATQTTAGAVSITILKRSTADTGGTSAAVTAVPHDSANSAATAAVLGYTANPTTGTLVGNLRIKKLFVPSTATAADGGSTEFMFGNRPGQAIVLRGATEQLAVNLGGATVAGNSFSIVVEWSEE